MYYESMRSKVSGDTVNVSISTNISGQPVIAQISGQPVYFVNNGLNNIVWISGQTVQIAAGGTINVSVSGNVVQLSGQTVIAIAKISGESISIIGTVPVSLASLPTISISGNAVYFVSGQNAVQISGQLILAKISGESVNIIGTVPVSTSVSGHVASISGQIVYLISGKNDVQISGQTIAFSNTSINTTFANTSIIANISGQTTYLTSGQNTVQISGQSISVIGTVPVSIAAIVATTTSVSGNAVRVSGETVRFVNDGLNNVVQISGQTIQGTFSANISGNVVYHVSGQNTVQISGQSVSIIGTVPVSTSISGNMVSISGQPVIANVTTNVSGNVVYLTSGQNSVQISGQTISVAGTIPVTTSISGNMVSISGQPVTANVTTNVSGNVVYFTSGKNDVQISGQTIYLTSGKNDVQISGQLVAVSGTVTTSISGNIVNTSGQVANISGSVVVISGQNVSLASGTNEVLLAANPTYYIYSDEVIIASGKQMLTIYNRETTKRIEINKLYISNLTTATLANQIVKFDVWVISGTTPVGGTAVSMYPADPNDPFSGAQATILTNAAVSGASLTPVRNKLFSIRQATGTSGGNPSNQSPQDQTQGINWMSTDGTQLKPVTLRQNVGITLMQASGASYTQVTSGTFGVLAVITIEG